MPENIPPYGSVDPAALEPPSYPMTTGNESALFNPRESLNSAEPFKQGRYYYPSPPEYTDDYSQSMLRPTTSALVPTEHHDTYDYLSNTPFTTAPAGDHHHPMTMSMPMPMQPMGSFDTWNPAFRPTMYSSMDLGPSQTLAQSPMQYPIPINSPQAELPHGLPELSRGRTSPWDQLNRSF